MTSAVIDRAETATGAAAFSAVPVTARSRRASLGMVAGGLAAFALAAGAFLLGTPQGATGAASPGAASTARADAPRADAPFPDVGVTELTYEPGHASGWHVHSGLHSVVVLSGTLTVYDDNCQRHQYVAGETYLGGRTAHLARNEGTEPAELSVTYVYQSHADPGVPVSIPFGCEGR